MNSKRYRKLSTKLCEETTIECFDGKWRRRDVLSFIEKYAGIPRADILVEELTGERVYRQEAISSCALALLETIERILSGEDPDDITPVTTRQQVDGSTGKVRDIARLCIMHQLIGHAAKKMMEPLFKAKLLPSQHASIPKHGQTRLKDQAHQYLLKESLGIRHIKKLDGVHAYASIQYSTCVALIKAELPKATELHAIVSYLGHIAPGGHLIIGGYLDAWLFNFAESYPIRHLHTLGSYRRGKFLPHVIRSEAFMDDVAIMTRSEKGVQRAVKALNKWSGDNLKMKLRETTGTIRLLSVQEEIERRAIPRGKAARGCPALDMAGFRICRTHVTIRKRVFLRARRQFIRGYTELQENGTLSRDRAQKIISYNSYVERTDSRYLAEKYHIKELMTMARRVSGFYSHLDNRKRKEALHVLQQRRIREKAGEGDTGEFTGRKDDHSVGEQYHRESNG